MTNRDVVLYIPQFFVYDQAHSMSSAKALRYSSVRIISLISSILMKSGMSVHDSIRLMVMHMPGISSPIFVLWVCLESQSAVNSSGPGFYSTLMLYWCINSSIL